MTKKWPKETVERAVLGSVGVMEKQGQNAVGARNQGREIFIFNFDPRHVILGIFISKNLFWASVYDFYINDFQGTWAF